MPGTGAVVLSTPSSFLPPFPGLLEGCCLSSNPPSVLLLDFPSFHLLCFLHLIFLLARL